MTGPTPPGSPMRPQPPNRPEPQTRPADVDTGFWLWAAALPLMVIGYVAGIAASPAPGGSAVVYAVSGVFVAVLCAIVVTFLVLMRAGYRWARTVLTGGAVATVVYVVTGLFSADRPPVLAVICAVTGIVGSVLIAGGVFLLHRADVHPYFTR
ncbi:MAG: hypothetical protein ACRDZY_03830 [Acidimicrobiales bacterium]